MVGYIGRSIVQLIKIGIKFLFELTWFLPVCYINQFVVTLCDILFLIVA